MSLTKLFNFNFFKQNVKKSKGGIILSLIIVPLIISVYMVITGMNAESATLIDDTSFGVTSLVFMYIIPFIYSVMLFGFVFKKPSTDFMNSIPINRKTMFTTNTIGGIGLITIIHLLSVGFVFLWSVLFKNLIVFPMDLIEVMLMSWCSYVFIFTAANLAMTISGTVMTQLVVTVLIVFLVPVAMEIFEGMKYANYYSDYRYEYDISSQSSRPRNYDLSISDGHQVTYYDLKTAVKNYTMPFGYMANMGYHFSGVVILKMLILSVIYGLIGLKLYQIRKMENNEESFGSVKLHILVKALTLIPVFLLLNLTDVSDNLTAFVVIVIFCAIYYFIFDLIIKRKIPFKTSVCAFVVTIFVLQASIGTIKFFANMDKVDIDVDDIKAISVGLNNNVKTGMFQSLSYSYSEYDDDNLIFDGNYFVDDSELLKLVLDGKHSYDNSDNNEGYNRINFNVKVKSGKVYNTTVILSTKNYNKIVRYLQKNEDYMKHIKNNLLTFGGLCEYNGDVIDSKVQKIIDKEIKTNLQDYDASDRYSSVYSISKVVYLDHRLVTYEIPIDFSDTTLKAIADFSNEQTLDHIRGYEYGLSADVYDDSESVGYISNDSELLDFIEEDSNKEFDVSTDYYIIEGNLNTVYGYETFVYFTNDIEEIESLKNENSYWY